MSDCVVIGGGLIGLLTARELMAAGLNLTLLERGEPARESSWAGGGILSPLYPWRYPDAVSELARWSQSVYPALCEQLQEDSGIDPQYTRSGLLIADSDDHAAATEWAERFDVQLLWPDAAEIHALEPRFALPVETAAWLPDVAQVRNPRLVKALRSDLENRGLKIRSHCPALGWDIEGERVRAVRTPVGAVHADSFVVASGAWTAGLLESTGLMLPIEPVRGQMILFRGPSGLVSRISLYKDRYVIPRQDGRILTGSTLEHTGFDKQTTEAALATLREAAFELIPDLARLPVEHHWAGLRPGSPRGVPLVGPHPRLSNLYINAGHYRNGVVLGPASARLLADHLTGRLPTFDFLPYLIEIK